MLQWLLARAKSCVTLDSVAGKVIVIVLGAARSGETSSAKTAEEGHAARRQLSGLPFLCPDMLAPAASMVSSNSP